jgi:hypothetical protein
MEGHGKGSQLPVQQREKRISLQNESEASENPTKLFFHKSPQIPGPIQLDAEIE